MQLFPLITLYPAQLNAFMQSKETLKDALELEKGRGAIKTPERHREELTLKTAINPWLADADWQFRAVPSYRCWHVVRTEATFVRDNPVQLQTAPSCLNGLLTTADLRSSSRMFVQFLAIDAAKSVYMTYLRGCWSTSALIYNGAKYFSYQGMVYMI